MGVTIKDIALRCGLSMATVSKALNYYSDVSDETREMVRRVAREMGYQSSPLARALKSQCSYHLGVLFVGEKDEFLNNYYYNGVLSRFKLEAERRGYDLTFISHNVGGMPMTYLEHCRLRNVDGVCVGSLDYSLPEIRALYTAGMPLVSIDYAFPKAPAIFSDNAGGMRMLLEHVYRQGHRRIAYVYGNTGDVTALRLKSFCNLMMKLRLPVPEGYLIQSAYHDAEGAREAVLKLLQHPERPTCIFTCDDYAALGAAAAIRGAGLRFPEDVSVAGFDGIQVMQQIRLKLTSIRQDTTRIGTEAANHLIRWIERPMESHAQRIVVPSTLLLGDTVTRIENAETAKIDSVLQDML